MKNQYRVSAQLMTATGVVFFAMISVESENQLEAVKEAALVATKKGVQVTLMPGAPAVPCLAVAFTPLFVDGAPDDPKSKLHLV